MDTQNRSADANYKLPKKQKKRRVTPGEQVTSPPATGAPQLTTANRNTQQLTATNQDTSFSSHIRGLHPIKHSTALSPSNTTTSRPHRTPTRDSGTPSQFAPPQRPAFIRSQLQTAPASISQTPAELNKTLRAQSRQTTPIAPQKPLHSDFDPSKETVKTTTSNKLITAAVSYNPCFIANPRGVALVPLLCRPTQPRSPVSHATLSATGCPLTRPSLEQLRPRLGPLQRPHPSTEFSKSLPRLAALYMAVINSNLPNYRKTREPLESNLNLSAWKQLLPKHSDTKLLHHLSYGFPLGYVAATPPQTQPYLHPAVPGSHRLLPSHGTKASSIYTTTFPALVPHQPNDAER